MKVCEECGSDAIRDDECQFCGQMAHEFKPYADIPGLCVEELPDSGDTCNREREYHNT